MKYSIGHQDFRKIREEGMHYVDKTEQVCRMVENGGYLFLSRPRRFGKSLTVATLNELYSGGEELFEGLWAEQHWDFAAKRRPVIWLQFASSGFQFNGLPAAIDKLITDEATRLNIEVPAAADVTTRFKQLIYRAAEGGRTGKVVLLIDEYDKPIINYLDDIPRAEENRDILKGFYGVLKDADPVLELVFITGVSAFSKVSLFSELNNLRNLTLHPAAFTIVGITQYELERDFGPQLDATGVSREEVKHWYNGYAWGEHETVYNPWSLLQFLETGQIQNFWSNSGTPTFITQILAQGGEYDVAPAEVDETQMTSFNLANLDPVSVLFQGGYLTVKRKLHDLHLYVLDYPNEEVRRTFQTALLGEYGFGDTTAPIARVMRLRNAFHKRDLETVIDIINASLARVPYPLWAKQGEAFVHAIIHTTFSVLGLYTRSEVSTSRGRADMVVEVPKYVYVIELKIVREKAVGTALSSLAEALAQIEARGYAKAYAGETREVVRVGMVVDLEKKEVVEWGEG